MTDYNPSIPQGSDNLSNSQVQLLNNFTQLNNIFDLDHFTWNNATVGNRGLHRKISFPSTTTVSSPTGSASVFYSKDVSGVPSPYFVNSTGSSVLWRGGSTNGLVSSVTGGNASNGALNLPNGIQLKWGLASSVADNGTITFPVAFPTACFCVVICGSRDNTTERALWVKPGYTRTSFQIRTDSTAFDVQYVAIGN